MIEDAIKEIYREAADFFAPIQASLASKLTTCANCKYKKKHSAFYGFKILNSRPIPNPKYLFIGYQPGGGCEDYKYQYEVVESHQRWPANPDYVRENYPFSKKMRAVFDEADLEKSVGTNAIFLRWPNTKIYKKEVCRKTRGCVASFSGKRIHKIVDVLDPQQIVVIGFDAAKVLRKFEVTAKIRQHNGSRDIIKRGMLFGRPAHAIIHLTGARPSNAEIEFMYKYFNKRKS